MNYLREVCYKAKLLLRIFVIFISWTNNIHTHIHTYTEYKIKT